MSLVGFPHLPLYELIIFVGYNSLHKGYLCYDPCSRISRNVLFLEHIQYSIFVDKSPKLSASILPSFDIPRSEAIDYGDISKPSQMYQPRRKINLCKCLNILSVQNSLSKHLYQVLLALSNRNKRLVLLFVNFQELQKLLKSFLNRNIALFQLCWSLWILLKIMPKL